MMSKTAAEPLVRISKREGTTFVQKVLVRAIAILLALVVDAFFIFFVTGLNPISVYGVMWNGTFMNTTRFSWALRELPLHWLPPLKCAFGTSAAKARC